MGARDKISMYKRLLSIDQTNKISTTNAFSFTGEQSFKFGRGGVGFGRCA